MADNLNIKGIAETEPPQNRRLKTKGKRQKPWKIEVRWPQSHWDFLNRWQVWSRYETKERRDQSFEVLTKRFGQAEYRKVDPE